jgi:hypothetical protein
VIEAEHDILLPPLAEPRAIVAYIAAEKAVLRGVPECQARGLSVHTKHADSEKMRKLPRLKNSLVCRIRLVNGAGRIQRTF